MNSSNFIRLCKLNCNGIGRPRNYSFYRFQLPHSDANASFLRTTFSTNNFKTFAVNRSALFKLEIDRHIINGGGGAPIINLWKPIAFTVAFICGTFVTVSIWEYERRASSFRAWFRNRIQSRARDLDPIDRMRNWWHNLRPSEKVFIPICAINCIVYGLWRVRQIHPIMINYFSSNPYAKIVCLPMLLSTFSHYSFWHLFANMFVLHSFSEPVVQSLGMEQFILLYLSSGVVANLSSYAYKVAISQVGMSLGASGAIMGILAYFCFKYPDHQLSIILMPAIAFPAALGIKALIAVDSAGCLFRWRFFDHAAHLGGALTGIAWYYYGQTIWAKRELVKKYWHQLKSPED